MKHNIMTDKEFVQFIKQAAQRNREISKEEREMGFAAAEESPISDHLFTCLHALESGILKQDWDLVGEVYALLKEALQRLETTMTLEVLMKRFSYGR